MPFQFRKEAIEEDLNSNFPSQGQGNPPLYYSLSEVVVPTYSINDVSAGSTLPTNLQTAWDFSTGFAKVNNAAGTSLITNPGFWQIDLTATVNYGGSPQDMFIFLDSGITTKKIWQLSTPNTLQAGNSVTDGQFVVFIKSGETLRATANANSLFFNIWYRQIAEPNGTLVNPLGFSFA